MSKLGNNAVLLYQFKSFDEQVYMSTYRRLLGAKDVVEYEPFVPLADFNRRHGLIDDEEWKRQHELEEAKNKGTLVHYDAKIGVVKSDDRIIEKVKYLQDAIIRRATAKKDTLSFTLSSKVLQKVLGHEYKTILNTLIELNYIRLGSDYGSDQVSKYMYYTIGKYSTLYTLIDTDVVEEYSVNQTIRKYKETTLQEYQSYQEAVHADVAGRYGDTFLKNYLVSLQKIGVSDETGLQAYVDERVLEKPTTKYYYAYVLNSLKEYKSVNKIDASGRMYHCLTNMDRNIKKYLTIDFMLDCKNSHPLLFNFFIYLYYNISFSKSYSISLYISSLSIDTSSISFHNVGKSIRKALNDSDIEKESVAKLTDDELSYIYLTSKGLLWDDIAQRHTDMTRDEVKVQMFQEVFYSNTPVAYQWKKYAVEFKAQFPNVYKRIGEWKKRKPSDMVKKYMTDNGIHADKPTASLSLAMMHLEAQVFTEILKRMYAKRWHAVHIHDCIVVPQERNQNHPTKEQVRSIMLDVYKSFGLSPTFS